MPGSALTVYHPFDQEIGGGRLFVHARGNPYPLSAPIRRIIGEMSADQPVERAATLEDIRAEVLTPDRLNALVFAICAAVALGIAVVGVGGVLAFSDSGGTLEFAIRLAVCSQPRDLPMRVIVDAVLISAAGIAAGALFGVALLRLTTAYFEDVRTPGVVVICGSAGLLIAAPVLASMLPAMRAARVDIVQALRSD